MSPIINYNLKSNQTNIIGSPFLSCKGTWFPCERHTTAFSNGRQPVSCHYQTPPPHSESGNLGDGVQRRTSRMAVVGGTKSISSAAQPVMYQIYHYPNQ